MIHVIKIESNGDLIIQPDATDANIHLTPNGTGTVLVDNLSLNNNTITTLSGNLILSASTNIIQITSTLNTTTINATTINADSIVAPGIIPLGGVISTFSNLSGSYNCTATTVADSIGFVVCGGQTINDATSPMNGDVIPNINNSVFLMGSSTAGTAGGSNVMTDHIHTNSLTAAGQSYSGNSGSVSSTAHTHSDSNVTGTIGTIVTAISINNGGSHAHNVYIQTWDGDHSDILTNIATGNTSDPNGIYPGATTTDGNHSHSINDPGHTHAHTLTAAGQTGGLHDHTVSITHSHSASSVSGTVGSGAAPSSTDNRPSYISAKFIMRIK